MPSLIPVFIDSFAQLRRDIEFHLISVASFLILCAIFAVCPLLYCLKRHAEHATSPVLDYAVKVNDAAIVRPLPSSLTRPPPSIRPAWDVDILPIQMLLSTLIILAEQEKYTDIPFTKELESNPWSQRSSQGEHPPENAPSQEAGPFKEERLTDNEVHRTSKFDEQEVPATNASHASHEATPLKSSDGHPFPSSSGPVIIDDNSDPSHPDLDGGICASSSGSFQDDHDHENPTEGGEPPEEERPAALSLADTERRRKVKGKGKEFPAPRGTTTSARPSSDDHPLSSSSRAMAMLFQDGSDTSRLDCDVGGSASSSRVSAYPAPSDRSIESRTVVADDGQDTFQGTPNSPSTSTAVLHYPKSPENPIVDDIKPAFPLRGHAVAGSFSQRLDPTGPLTGDSGKSRRLESLEDGNDAFSLSDTLIRSPSSSIASLNSAESSTQEYYTSMTNLSLDEGITACESDDFDITQHNHALPEDVLAYILQLGPADAGWASLVNASHVCHSWRDVALNYPALWSSIPLRSSGASGAFLKRSRDAPLHITLRAVPREPPAIPMHKYFACLYPHMERLQSLNLDLGAAAMFDFFGVCRAWRTPPPLETLSLRLHTAYSLSIPVDIIRQFTSLRSLNLHNFDFAIFSQPLDELKQLKISVDQATERTPVSTNSFIFSLSQMQQLQCLELEGIDFHEPVGSVRASLPQLSSVTVTGSRCNALLSQLSFSSSLWISVRCLATPDDSMHSLGMSSSFWKEISIDHLQLVSEASELLIRAWSQDTQTDDMVIEHAEDDEGFAGRIAQGVRPMCTGLLKLEIQRTDLKAMRPFLVDYLPKLENLKHLILDGCSSIAVLVDAIRTHQEQENLPSLNKVEVLHSPAAIEISEWQAVNWLKEKWPAA